MCSEPEVISLFAITFPHVFGFWNFNAGFVIPVDALTLKCCLCRRYSRKLLGCLFFVFLYQGSCKYAGYQACEIFSKFVVAVETSVREGL